VGRVRGIHVSLSLSSLKPCSGEVWDVYTFLRGILQTFTGVLVSVYSVRCVVAAPRAEGDSRRRRSVGRSSARDAFPLLCGRKGYRAFVREAFKNGEKKDDAWTCRRPRCADHRCEEG
jgi:hypothetical protein